MTGHYRQCPQAKPGARGKCACPLIGGALADAYDRVLRIPLAPYPAISRSGEVPALVHAIRQAIVGGPS